jgi:spore maturation protein CgeE
MEDEVKIEFRDSLLVDMYDHNFTLVKKKLETDELNALICDEIKLRKDEEGDFCHLMLYRAITRVEEETIIGKPEISRDGYYIYEADDPDFMNVVKDCEIKKVSTPKMIEDLLYCDIMLDGGRLSEDFCHRRAYRRGEVSLAGIGLSSYIWYHLGKPVGKCDLFISGKAAKIEDFEVIPDQQRKGYGTTILHYLILEALAQGCDLIYLVTDEDDMVKDMYRHLGFRKVWERTELFYHI